MNRARGSITSVFVACMIAACGSSTSNNPGQGGSTNTGTGGSNGGANGGNSAGGSAGGNQAGGAAGNPSGGSAGNAAGGKGTGGSGVNPNGGSAGNAGGDANGGAGGNANGGAAGNSQVGGQAGGAQDTGGTPGGTGGAAAPSTVLVTSASGAYWKTGTWTESTGNATVTVNDGSAAQKWEGFGGAFNELGWKFLESKEMQDEALKLLFSATDGANFAWGRIPMGASDYGTSRYTLDDTGDDVAPNGDESNRPPADTSLSKFSLDRDGQKLIPYIKAALQVKPDIRFWASPWTPPVWMKTGYMKVSGVDRKAAAKKPSYYDGGTMKNDSAILTAYAQYYTKFVQGYKDQGIKIEIVSPQNEPGYDQNYPSCIWDSATYVSWIKTLGQAMSSLNVKVMLGTLSNEGNNGYDDVKLANAVLADSAAKEFLAVAGAQWGVLGKVVDGSTNLGGLPIWATEHKCGNYPWESAYKTPAPNDQAYGVESWGYIRDAIKKGKVTAYNAWNMVLDKSGLGIDTTRVWGQDSLLVADSGKVNATPAYYVFRHFSQYVTPGATVVGTSGGDAVAFKNPDGSLVAVMFNSGGANNNYVVSIGGKKLQFAMPGNGWATVKYKP